jgi:hypothetical protein
MSRSDGGWGLDPVEAGASLVMWQDEVVPEFRELIEACSHLLERKYDFVVTPGDWKQFMAEVEKAKKFVEQEIDGPKET